MKRFVMVVAILFSFSHFALAQNDATSVGSETTSLMGGPGSSTTSSLKTAGSDSPLHEALKKGNLIKTRKLLDAGADVDARDSQGATPLILAVKRKDLELVKALLDYGAAAGALAADGTSPLGVAASAGDIVGVKLLLDRGADAELVDGNGFSALMHAVVADDPVITQLLLERGARFEGTTRNGKSVGELVKPGGRVSVLPQVPTQVDAAAIATAASKSGEDTESEASSSSSASVPPGVTYQPAPERAKLTRVRLGAPVGKWKKKKGVTLDFVQIEARNVGEVRAKDIKVTAIVPGGEIVSLDGPAELDPNESYIYNAKPGVSVSVTGNLKSEVSCSNCRR